MSKVVNIPQLRFPEFSDMWIETKVGDFISLLTDYHANGSYEKLKENVTLLDKKDFSIMVRTTNLSNNDFSKNLLYIDENAYHFLKKSKVYENDIVINKIADAGATYLIPELNMPASLGMNLFLLRIIKDVSSRFAFISIKCSEQRLRLLASGTSTKTITKEDVRGFKVFLPTKQEQQKIAAFLTAVDNKIEQLIKKQELLGEYKKGLMQQIFSQAIRFKADDGSDFPNWEEKKLGDVVSTPVSDGPHLTPKFVKQGVPFLSVNNLVESKIDFSNVRYISIDDHLVFSKKCKPKKGDVLLGKAASVGKVAFVETDVEFNIWSPIAMIRPGNSNFSKYIYYCFQTRFILNQISKFTNSSSQGNIGMGDINKIIIKLPNKLEQTKIANLLSSIDSKIEQVGKQLRESKQFKKALLQQMFV